MSSKKEAIEPTKETNEPTKEAPLSKNQLKKQRRWQHKLAVNQRRKAQEKQVRLERAKLQGRNLDEERAQQVERYKKGVKRQGRIEEWRATKLPRMDASFKVLIDCHFTGMTVKELNSLALQLRYCYSLNKKHDYPVHLSVSSVQTVTYQALQTVCGFDEWQHWGMHVTTDDLLLSQVASQRDNNNKANDIVYLTSDSPNRLETPLDATKTAEQLGVDTARLPIAQHMSGTTHVLTVNHVMELLLTVRNKDDCWEAALAAVLPRRKCPANRSMARAATTTNVATRTDDPVLEAITKTEQKTDDSVLEEDKTEPVR